MNETTQDSDEDQDQGTPVPPTPKAPDCETCPFRIKAMEGAGKKNSQPPPGTPMPRLIDEIRRLDLPGRAKAELALLCVRAKALGIKVLRFLERHRHLGEAAVLGAFVAYALCFIPWIGGFLALVALGMSVASGVIRELREDLAALFAAEMPAQA